MAGFQLGRLAPALADYDQMAAEAGIALSTGGPPGTAAPTPMEATLFRYGSCKSRSRIFPAFA